MNDAHIGDIMADIGRITLRDGRTDWGKVFLYTEAESMMVAASIFVELPDHVIYRHPSLELTDLILEAWEAVDEQYKWKALFYTVSDGSFDARFRYADPDWNEDEHFSQRRPLVLEAKYGDKPIDYSDP